MLWQIQNIVQLKMRRKADEILQYATADYTGQLSDREPDYPLCGDMDYRIEDTGGFYGNVSQKQVCRD